MPAIVTHTYFTSSIIKKAKPHISAAASADTMAFYWGGLGPDPLFFYRPWGENTVSGVGHLMHEKQISRAFRAMIRECSAMQNPSATAYLLGFCCHYALDKTLHPYVTYTSNYTLYPQYPTLSYSALHNLCESELDRVVVEKILKQNNSTFRSHRLYRVSKSASDAASNLLSSAAWRAYGKRISPKQVTASMHSMIHIHHMLSNPTGRRADAVNSIEKLLASDGHVSSLMRPAHPLPVDCTNSEHKPWIDASIPHMRRYEDFYELIKKAQVTAVQLMEYCYDCVQTGKTPSDEFFQLNYSGIPVK